MIKQFTFATFHEINSSSPLSIKYKMSFLPYTSTAPPVAFTMLREATVLETG